MPVTYPKLECAIGKFQEILIPASLPAGTCGLLRGHLDLRLALAAPLLVQKRELRHSKLELYLSPLVGNNGERLAYECLTIDYIVVSRS